MIGELFKAFKEAFLAIRECFVAIWEIPSNFKYLKS